MNKKSNVTQKQIAKEAGVSQTTVSLILNNSHDVVIGEETRQRVLAVAETLGYVPQAAARTLVQGHSSNLGLILVQPHFQVFRDPFIPNIITGMSAVLRENGFRLLVEHINDVSEMDTIRTMLKGGEVAGIALNNFHWAEHIVAPLVDEGYPVVNFTDPQSTNYNAVDIDHFTGVATAVNHLLTLGHREIACITYSPPEDNLHLNKRLESYYDALALAGISPSDTLVRYGNYEPESGYHAMRSLLRNTPRPTAVFGMNDLMALGAIHAIHESGLRIPEDIAVVGYDNMRFAAFTNPPLTTIHAPEIEMGRTAGEMLVNIVSGRSNEPQRITLPTELFVRQSCGASQKQPYSPITRPNA